MPGPTYQDQDVQDLAELGIHVPTLAEQRADAQRANAGYEEDVLGGGIAGSMQGMTAGSSAGPWGMVIGGIAGGLLGNVMGARSHEEATQKKLAALKALRDPYSQEWKALIVQLHRRVKNGETPQSDAAFKAASDNLATEAQAMARSGTVGAARRAGAQLMEGQMKLHQVYQQAKLAEQQQHTTELQQALAGATSGQMSTAQMRSQIEMNTPTSMEKWSALMAQIAPGAAAMAGSQKKNQPGQPQGQGQYGQTYTYNPQTAPPQGYGSAPGGTPGYTGSGPTPGGVVNPWGE